MDCRQQSTEVLLQLDLGGCNFDYDFQAAATSREGGTLPVSIEWRPPLRWIDQRSPPTTGFSITHLTSRRGKAPLSRVEARAKEKNACPWSSEFGLRLAFEFTARSNAQKGRALQPNGEKRSHGVDSFIRQPNHNFHEIPLPISLTQQDSSSRQPQA
jgi:hypothetical protein